MKKLLCVMLFVICYVTFSCNSNFALRGLEKEALERYKEQLPKYATECGDSLYFKQVDGNVMSIGRIQNFSFEEIGRAHV